MNDRLSLSYALGVLAVFLLFFADLTQAAAAPQSLTPVRPVMSCSALGATIFTKGIDAGVSITSAQEQKTAQGTFCLISATLSPSIGVQVALPEEKWTQRMLQVGCGGLCGQINLGLSDAKGCIPAMNGEFAVSSTDMGHSGSMMDAAWALDPQKRIDFAYRAQHVTAQFTKSVIRTFYGQPQQYAYFMGCSDGGREALMEAQRYPEDFNGISAGAPAAWFSTQNSFFHGWNVTANLRADGTPVLLQSRLALLHEAVITHCPTLSDVSDGLLENPFACHFSRAWVRQCAPGQQDKSACMTSEELEVAENLYRGAHDDRGNQFVPAGLPPGSELRWPVPANEGERSMSEMMALPALQYILLPGGKQSLKRISDFDFNYENFRRVAELAPLYNATNTNLKPFQAAGGRLILWHGLADDSISPAGTVDYFRGVQHTMGTKETDSFMRLFLLPGVAHCGKGEGPDQIDVLSALMDWTEKDVAPASLLAGKTESAGQHPSEPPAGTLPDKADIQDASAHFHDEQKQGLPYADAPAPVTMTRPVFPYPYVARYRGKGDPLNAADYVPVRADYYSLRTDAPVSSLLGPDNQRTYNMVNGRLISH
ncbi:tannase/feruloyl esterase family alpha/beta hydrolase [Pantoea vagans]|uniref:tannase/feruloyl esterase family alpha/beta hydrolase n=1 Tax=Pantoea vagans TaxID=470934 RepID=UPI0023AFC3EA|nr:tannase/feruloyl esterase family alpha/beta hydrolase [Pantoea vagans]MDE8559400.1 tannase/feruloyl esterase family alpha/beta hydrolase [Pantoea vagans]MDE8579395.1 tannase/feruloyl esterase family alpha/beta hydrolase [Pantoea vagans]